MKLVTVLGLVSIGCAAPAPRLPISPPFQDPCGTAPWIASFIALKHTSADPIAGTLKDLVSASRKAAAERSRGFCALYPPGAPFPEPQPLPLVLADSRTNTILVAAPPEDLERLVALVDRLDAASR